MVTTIGDSSNYDGYVSDHVTPASGSYVWYFKTKNVPIESEDYPLYPGTELLSSNFSHLGQQIGWRSITWKISEALLNQGSDYDNLKKAMAYWTKEGKLLYFSFKNEAGTDIAKIYNSTYTQVTMRIKILKLRKQLLKGVGKYSCTIDIAEFTA